MLDLEKSLVYFHTSLKANEITIRKISRGKFLKLYEEDQDLLDDVLIEMSQAIEMCDIYSSILSGTMDAFASVLAEGSHPYRLFRAAMAQSLDAPSSQGMSGLIPFLL